MRITDKLLRQRSEHNEGLLDELEEVALHQLEIEKIENLDKLCRHLKILLLQNNIIEKIENLSRLKELEYLNLALNNIIKIENLQGCESLKKLDLTVNFIDVDTLEESVRNLQANEKLEDLYLMGNPCTEWQGWRRFVVLHLPQLRQLDGKLITPTERIESERSRDLLRKELSLKIQQKQEQQNSLKKNSCSSSSSSSSASASSSQTPDTSQTAAAYTRENRKKMYLDIAREREEKERKRKEAERAEHRKKPSSPPSVYNEKGEIRQCNQGGYAFTLDDWSDPGKIIMEVETPRYLCLSAIDADVHPTYIRVTIKNKVTQLRLPAEISVENSKVQRCRSTGRLRFELSLLNPPPLSRRLSSSSSRLRRSSEKPTAEEKKPDSARKKLSEGEKPTSSSSVPCFEEMLDITGKAGVYTPGIREKKERKKAFASDFLREVCSSERKQKTAPKLSSCSSSSTAGSSTAGTEEEEEESGHRCRRTKRDDELFIQSQNTADEEDEEAEEQESIDADDGLPDLETVS